MKNTIFIFLLFFIAINFQSIYSQETKLKNYSNSKLALQKFKGFSFYQLLNQKINELKNYKEAFKFSKDLINNTFFIDSNKTYYTLIFNSLKSRNKANKNNTIAYKKSSKIINGLSINYLEPINEKNFIDFKKTFKEKQDNLMIGGGILIYFRK